MAALMATGAVSEAFAARPSRSGCFLQIFVDEETAFLKMALKAGFIKERGLSPKMWKILKPLE